MDDIFATGIVVGGVVMFAVMLVICVCITFPAKHDEGYKQGQIDAMNEIIKYKLEKQPDGSSEWIEMEENNENKKTIENVWEGKSKTKGEIK